MASVITRAMARSMGLKLGELELLDQLFLQRLGMLVAEVAAAVVVARPGAVRGSARLLAPGLVGDLHLGLFAPARRPRRCRRARRISPPRRTSPRPGRGCPRARAHLPATRRAQARLRPRASRWSRGFPAHGPASPARAAAAAGWPVAAAASWSAVGRFGAANLASAFFFRPSLQFEVLTQVHLTDLSVGKNLIRRSGSQHRSLAHDVRTLADAEGLPHIMVGNQHADALIG